MKKSIIAMLMSSGLVLSACGSSSPSYVAGYDMIAGLTGRNVLVSSTSEIYSYCQQAIGLGDTNGYNVNDYEQGCRDATNDWWKASNGGVDYSVSIPAK
jgi:hypothetical protein